MMYKNVLLLISAVVLFSGCVGSKILLFGELDEAVANQGQVINNFNGTVLTLEATPNTEVVSIVLPKDDLTVRVRIKVDNIEDVLYMNIVTEDEFKINKLIRRVSSLDELDLNQDGWMFEPSIEKGVITLQLYLPTVYLYSSKFSPKLMFSYKRSSRALQENISFNFIKQKYLVVENEDGMEIPEYKTLEKFCETGNGAINENFYTQIEELNKDRIEQDTIDKLKSMCQ